MQDIKKRMNKRGAPTLMTLIIYLKTGNIPQTIEYLKYSSKKAAILLAQDNVQKIHSSFSKQIKHMRKLRFE